MCTDHASLNTLGGPSWTMALCLISNYPLHNGLPNMQPMCNPYLCHARWLDPVASPTRNQNQHLLALAPTRQLSTSSRWQNDMTCTATICTAPWVPDSLNPHDRDDFWFNTNRSSIIRCKSPLPSFTGPGTCGYTARGQPHKADQVSRIM